MPVPQKIRFVLYAAIIIIFKKQTAIETLPGTRLFNNLHQPAGCYGQTGGGMNNHIFECLPINSFGIINSGIGHVTPN